MYEVVIQAGPVNVKKKVLRNIFSLKETLIYIHIAMDATQYSVLSSSKTAFVGRLQTRDMCRNLSYFITVAIAYQNKSTIKSNDLPGLQFQPLLRQFRFSFLTKQNVSVK